jgi:hypothetical protein
VRVLPSLDREALGLDVGDELEQRTPIIGLRKTLALQQPSLLQNLVR